MKKLFTFVVAAFAALTANADVKDLITDPITIAAYEEDGQTKWAETEPIVVKSSDISVNDFLKLTITDAEAAANEQNVLQVKKADGNVLYYGSSLNPSPNSVITIPVNQAIYDVITKDGFKLGGAVQQKSGTWPAVVGKKIVVSKISVQPASDFMVLDLTSKNAPTEKAWSGVTIPAANFKVAKAGDVIVVTTTADDEIRSEGNFQFNMGKAQLNGWNIPAFFVMTLTDDDVTNINSTNNPQWYYQGAKFPVSATALLYRQKTDIPTAKSAIDVESTTLGEWENSVVLAKENFANVEAGDEVHLSISDFKEYKKDGESWTRRGQLQLKSGAEDWPAVSSVIDVFDVAEAVFVLTEEQVAAAKEFGLVVAGECMTVTGASVFTKTPSTGISSAVVASKANPKAPIYNLAGQKVSKSYKGVVIQNGKKFVQ